MRALNGIHLSSLRAVEAVARRGTLRAAADEMGVTPGAVSQQIIRAEVRLGAALFDRQPKGMVPTEAGKRMSSDLTRGFRALAAGVSAVGRPEGEIVVSAAPVLAGKWLMPRLRDFHDENPDLHVRVEASLALIDPNDGTVDACLRIGRGPWPGVRTTHLFDQRVFPICAPGMGETIRDPADLLRHPIIREPAPMFGWDVWLGPHRLDADTLRDGPILTDASLCLDAAAVGQGVFLAWETLATDALREGRIVAPLAGRVATGLSYWLVEPERQARRRGIGAFRKWIVRMAAGTKA